jgi:hypothetical protein
METERPREPACPSSLRRGALVSRRRATCPRAS